MLQALLSSVAVFAAGCLVGMCLICPALYVVQRSARKSRWLAFTDVLTGLPNRAAFFERAPTMLAAHVRTSTAVVGLLDLDGFKRINDTWGHETGDWVLQEVAGRLSRAVRGLGVVARLGGDEFALVLTASAPGRGTQWIKDFADRTCEAVAQPLALSGYHLPPVTASLGLRMLSSSSRRDLKQTLHEADIAMYYAKQRHNSFAVYDPYEMVDPSPSREARPSVRVRECRDVFRLFTGCGSAIP